MRQAPYLFKFLPPERLTPAFLDACIASNKQVIPEVFAMFPDHSIDFEALVQIKPTAIVNVPSHQRTQAMKEQAVRLIPGLIAHFENDPDPGYSKLCGVALTQEGEALRYIPRHRITLDMVELALNSEPLPRIQDIPESMLTSDICQQLLQKAPAINHESMASRYYPENFLERFPDLMPYRSRFFHWLAGLPVAKRTEALCTEFIQQFPGATHLIPEPVLSRHPEWQQERSIPPNMDSHYVSLWTVSLADSGPEACRNWFNHYGPLVDFSEEHLRPGTPPWVCLTADPKVHRNWLPEHLISHLVRHGGPDGPAAPWDTTVETISEYALLYPAQEFCCPREVALIPFQTRKRLMFCRPFVLRNQRLGWGLQNGIDKYCKVTEPLLEQACFWESDLQTAKDWQVHGGRVLCQSGQSPCRRLKFLRAGEPLTQWLTEAAVQKFALQHKSHLGLRSEIPTPQAF
ncbi:hypothetical protein, partial [Sansalvadorimonas verongulae]|uniref:hypothetical protein n=1 Tax=Sansalvadorimonas verongulae TaxID=2172824 RepID=UPI0012BD02A0